jgi:hypothetical protein
MPLPVVVVSLSFSSGDDGGIGSTSLGIVWLLGSIPLIVPPSTSSPSSGPYMHYRKSMWGLSSRSKN